MSQQGHIECHVNRQGLETDGFLRRSDGKSSLGILGGWSLVIVKWLVQVPCATRNAFLFSSRLVYYCERARFLEPECQYHGFNRFHQAVQTLLHRAGAVS